MHITVNGNAQELAAGATLETLLQQLELSNTKVALEHNRVIVPRGQYAQTEIADGDAIEIVEFIGGG